LAAHFAGTAGSCLITPMNPEGHLLTSIDRLVLQIAPVALLATLVAFYRLGLAFER
jgi:hypothetical protein